MGVGMQMCCLLTGPNLWKIMLLKCSIPMVFTCTLITLYKISVSFRKKQYCSIILSFPHLHVVGQLVFICLQGQFSILRMRSCPALYPLIRPPRRSSALGREIMLILGLIRSLPMLAVYVVAQPLRLGDEDKDFPLY